MVSEKQEKRIDSAARKDEIGKVLATIAEMHKEIKHKENSCTVIEDKGTIQALELLVYRLYGDRGMYYLSTLDYEDKESAAAAQMHVIEAIAGGQP
jgi:hypothetical protein